MESDPFLGMIEGMYDDRGSTIGGELMFEARY